jgi:hypothetical protein
VGEEVARLHRARVGVDPVRDSAPVPAGVVGEEGLVELDVQVDRAPVLVRAQEGEELVEVGAGHVAGVGEGAEDADLVGRLVGPRAAQPRRTVGGDDDQRHPCVRRLHHGREQVGDRGAGGADDGCRDPTHLRQAERQEARGPLVDTRVEAQATRLSGVVQREGERRVA